jgi:hypothetical protein
VCFGYQELPISTITMEVSILKCLFHGGNQALNYRDFQPGQNILKEKNDVLWILIGVSMVFLL